MMMFFVLILFFCMNEAFCQDSSVSGCRAPEVVFASLDGQCEYKPVVKKRKKCCVRSKIKRMLKKIKKEKRLKRKEQEKNAQTQNAEQRAIAENKLEPNKDGMQEDKKKFDAQTMQKDIMPSKRLESNEHTREM